MSDSFHTPVKSTVYPIPCNSSNPKILAGPQSEYNTIVALCAAAALSTAVVLQQKYS